MKPCEQTEEQVGSDGPIQRHAAAIQQNIFQLEDRQFLQKDILNMEF